MLFARRGGTIDIPPLPVVVEVKTWGAGGGKVLKMQTPATRLEAKLPPGSENTHDLISTTGFTAEQSWQPDLTKIQTGDAIKRTITINGDDVPGMALMPTHSKPINGVGIYPGEPIVSDRYYRGELSGTRIDSISYVFEQAGIFELPTLEFSWWDIASESLQQVVLEGGSIEVTPTAAGSGGETVSKDEKSPYLQAGTVLLAVLCLLLFIFRRRITDHWKACRQARAESESRYFKQLTRSLRSGDVKASVRDLMRWLDRINGLDQPALLEDFLLQYGDAELEQSINQMMHGTDTAGGLSNSSQIIKGLESARRRWLTEKQPGRDNAYVLAEMNRPHIQ